MADYRKNSLNFAGKIDAGLGFLVLMMMILICVEVIGRKIFKYSTLIADEYAGYGLAVVSLIGLAGTMRAGAHINVSFMYDKFSPRFRTYADLFANLLAVAYSAILTWYLIDREIYLFTTKTTSIAYSQTLLYIPHAAMPAGGLILLVYLLGSTKSIIREIRSSNRKDKVR